MCGEQKEELENMKKQHDLLKKMLEQQEQLRALQGRQAELLAMQQSAEQAMAVMDDTGAENKHAFSSHSWFLEIWITSFMLYACVSVVTETTGSVSGRSITSELNDELNDLIQRFHNQLHDTQVYICTPYIPVTSARFVVVHQYGSRFDLFLMKHMVV